MLTFQSAPTAARSNQPNSVFGFEHVEAYLEPLQSDFTGSIQLQGGITTQTVVQAIQLGAEFLVLGTQIFRSDCQPYEVIDTLLRQIADDKSCLQPGDDCSNDQVIG